VSLRIALEDLELKSGIGIRSGDTVVIRLDEVNRDPEVWGGDADDFVPMRTLPDGVMPWGLSFGHGVHACLGQELAGGVEYLDRLEGSDVPVGHLVGAITVMAQSMLSAGARPDRLQPPRRDTGTTRQVWGSYPVRFDRWEAAGTSA
ncbi:MAG: cytochrome P450, partial [Actinomycetota bacterium]